MLCSVLCPVQAHHHSLRKRELWPDFFHFQVLRRGYEFDHPEHLHSGQVESVHSEGAKLGRLRFDEEP